MTDWRLLFASSSNNSLEFFPPSVVDGVPTVVPPAEVFDEGIDEWKFSVVSQFLGKPPNFSLLSRVLANLWGKKGFRGVRLLRSPLYLLQFESAAARDWVLENGPWHVQHNPMILRKWEPDLGRINFDLEKLPVWVHLHHVPLELFHKNGLGYLASALGTPLYMDSITASRQRLAYAKVCVEIDAAKDVPDQIPVVLRDGSPSSVAVSIPWKPLCCKGCKKFGHSDGNCPKAKPTSQQWQPKSNPILPAICASTSDSAKETTPIVPNLELALVNPTQPVVNVKNSPPQHSTQSDSEGFKTVSRKNSAKSSLNHTKASYSDGYSKKVTQITGSTNKFLSLCQNDPVDVPDDINSEHDENKENVTASSSSDAWCQLIDNALPRKSRAAAQGAAKVLQDMKSRKGKKLAKVAKQVSSTPKRASSK